MLFIFRYSSVWILVVMTAEKTLAILFPLKNKIFATLKMAKIITAIVIGLWVAFNIQWFFIIEKDERDGEVYCYYKKHINEKYQEDYEVLDSVFYSFFPCLTVFVLNITIIIRLLITRYSSALTSQVTTLSKTAITTSFLLLSVSVTFTILTFPNTIIHVLEYMGYTIRLEYRVLTVMLHYGNHSCNALMYTLIGRKFRQEVVKFLCGTEAIKSGSSSQASSKEFDSVSTISTSRSTLKEKTSGIDKF